MSLLSEALLSWSGLCDNASGFPMERPGQWISLKSKQAKYRDQRAWWQLSFLAIMKYSRFLWSV